MKKNVPAKTALPFGLPIMEILTEEEQRQLEQLAYEVHYPAGKFLVESGTFCENVYVVLNGLIRVFKVSEEGREITYYRVGNGEACLFTMGCILDHAPFEAQAQVEKDSQVLAIPGHFFEALIQNNARFRNYVITRLLTTITDLMQLTEAVTFGSMNQRLAHYLLSLRQHQGKAVLSVTHETISQELGTAREVVSRMLKEWEKNGFVSLSRGKIKLLNLKQLEHFTK